MSTLISKLADLINHDDIEQQHAKNNKKKFWKKNDLPQRILIFFCFHLEEKKIVKKTNLHSNVFNIQILILLIYLSKRFIEFITL